MRHLPAALVAAVLLVLGLPVSSVDAAGQGPGQPPAEPRRADTADRDDTAADGVARLGGEDRYATSAVIAESAHGDERGAVAVLARGDAFADALAGVPLAHHLDAPMLLTRPDGLPDVTRDALARLLVDGATVHVLGGPTAVGDGVVAELEAAGHRVRRHAGATRYGTAAAIADALPPSDLAYVASGVEPADALAAAPVAARRAVPVLLTDPARLPEETAGALEGIARVVLVGGRAAVSGEVAKALDDGRELTRIAGEDRFETAVAVARQTPGEIVGVSLASGRSWPDALTGASHAAATDRALLLADTDRLTWPTAGQLTRWQALPVTVYGGPQAVAGVIERDVELARTSDVDAPALRGISPGRRVEDGTDVRLTFTSRVASAELTVDPSGGGDPHVDGASVVVGLPGTEATEVAVTVEGAVRDTEGRVRRLREVVTVLPPVTTRPSPEGFAVAAGTGEVVGTAGPLVRYTVEVEPATGRPMEAVLPVVVAALEDPDRGWSARGERRFQRVDDPAAAQVRVVLATPDTVDAFCARHGLNTAGTFSCWDGRRAMLNLMRWDHGASDFDDVGTYRTYLVNHESGHGLGEGHVDCPAPDVLAPVMMQQTKTTGACRANGWPHP